MQVKSLKLRAVGMLALLASSVTCIAEDRSPEAPIEWPTTAWSVSSPEAQGMSSADLADGLQFALANSLNVHSVTIVRHGVVVLDAYFYPFKPNTRHDVASVTKSVVSLLTGIATTRGYLRGPDQPLVTALDPQDAANVDAALAGIRLGDLLTMRSGFDCGFKGGEPELRDMRSTNDWVAHALRLPMTAEPGTRFGYCSPNFHLLSAAISSSTHASALDFARQYLFQPLGITDVYWPADAKGITHGWGDLQLQPRDMAKIGLLMLREGRWQDQQVVSKAWIDASVKNHFQANDSNDYGLGWWMPRRIPGLFEATGRGGQRISITPEKDIVVVITGGGFEPYDIGQFILKAVRSDGPLPADPANQRKLADAVGRIAAAPARRVAAKPTVLSQFSGRVYNLEKNPLGVRAIAVEFADPNAGSLNIELENGEKLVQPLGMNGQYRAKNENGAAILAGRAEWFEDGRLRVEYNRLSLINRFVFDFAFMDRDLDLVVSEPTEFGALRVRGVARK